MKIIAGSAGRIPIKAPAKARPTTDFVRQAIFSILGNEVAEARVLDLFAGSGALGLEALSRGAASCFFVEENSQACAVIGENLKKARLEGGRVIKAEAAAFLGRDSASYELIFADPPYLKQPGQKDHITHLLSSGLLAPRLAPGGWFIAEIPNDQPTPEPPEHLALVSRRQYGYSSVVFYQREPSPA